MTISLIITPIHHRFTPPIRPCVSPSPHKNLNIDDLIYRLLTLSTLVWDKLLNFLDPLPLSISVALVINVLLYLFRSDEVFKREHCNVSCHWTVRSTTDLKAGAARRAANPTGLTPTASRGTNR